MDITGRDACTCASTSTSAVKGPAQVPRVPGSRYRCGAQLGGSLSGEHGDGQARAALLPKMFGPELMQAFREFKTLWDPDNRMNPGKLIDAVRVYDPIENLRKGIQRHEQSGEPPSDGPRQEEGADQSAVANPELHFAFSRDRGSLEHATERCVGVGACRNTVGGVMCPSYRATGARKALHARACAPAVGDAGRFAACGRVCQ